MTAAAMECPKCKIQEMPEPCDLCGGYGEVATIDGVTPLHQPPLSIEERDGERE